VVLWFDAEDYIEPAADDAALRLDHRSRQVGRARDVQSRWRIRGHLVHCPAIVAKPLRHTF
jgi:hypothetical protein